MVALAARPVLVPVPPVMAPPLTSLLLALPLLRCGLLGLRSR
jgi:hypothetical protein